MDVNLIRIVDKRIGIPLCFILSMINKGIILFKKPKRISNPQKILFIELFEMGSMVLAYSLFKKTKELFPNAKFYFLTSKKNQYTIDLLNIVPKENIIKINADNFITLLITTLKVIYTLRRQKIDIAIDMELFARFTAILAYLIGAKNTVGYYKYTQEGLYRGTMQTHKVEYNPHIHIAHNLLNLIYAVALPEKQIPYSKRKIIMSDIVVPKIHMSYIEKQNIRNKLEQENIGVSSAKKIILLNPNASELIPIRRWPMQNYICLAKLLINNHPGIYIVITGTTSERADADEITVALNSPQCINFAGKTSFRELIALYSISNILITNDSGPAHFSALTDIFTFVFFGPETPALYGPIAKKSRVFYSKYACSPCVSAFNYRKTPCTDNKCLQAISAEEVYAAITNYL